MSINIIVWQFFIGIFDIALNAFIIKVKVLSNTITSSKWKAILSCLIIISLSIFVSKAIFFLMIVLLSYNNNWISILFFLKSNQSFLVTML